MNCIKHTEASAVAICRSCGRAMCTDCIMQAGMAVTCSEECANYAKDMDEMMTRGKAIYGMSESSSSLSISVVMWLVFGVLFLGWGVYDTVTDKPNYFSIAFGVVCMFLSGITHRRHKKIGIQY